MKFGCIILKQAILAIVLATSAFAEDDIRLKIAGSSIPHVFDQNDRGPYNTLMDKILEAYPYKIQLEMMPLRRAQSLFKKEQSDCAFIGNDSPTFHERLGFNTSRLIFSKPFYTNSIKVYTAVEKDIVSGAGALDGSVAAADLGTMQGHLMRQNAPSGMEILTVETMERAFELLERGRVSSVVAFSLDAEVYFKRAGVKDKFHASADFNIAKTNEAIVCWDNERTREFLRYADQVLENAEILKD